MARPKYTWISSAPASWTNLASATNALVAPMATAEESSTLRRIIVDCFIQSQSMIDGGAWHGRVGLIIADPTVVAAGVTALPKPLADGDQEWLWNRGYAGNHESSSVTAVSQPPLHLHDDVRGMRKVKQRDALAFVIENQTGLGIRFMITVRVLFSL